MLDGKISEIETAIRQVPELQAIEKLLSDAKGMLLKDVIETHTEIVEFLTLNKLSELAQILPLYQIYVGIATFQADVQMTDFVLDSLYTTCDTITTMDTLLENKIILAMAIRHKAEEYMIREISQYQGQISWRIRRQTYCGTNVDFLAAIACMSNQTRELLNGYKQFGALEPLSVLNEVNIMTPENIHLNSFMYEPILDMDIVELLDLYYKIKRL